MRRVSAWLVFLGAVASAGCGLSFPDEVASEELIGGVYVEQNLAPGALKVSRWWPWWEEADATLELQVSRSRDGARLVEARYQARGRDELTHDEALLVVEPSGAARRVARAADAPSLLSEARDEPTEVFAVNDASSPVLLECFLGGSMTLATTLTGAGELVTRALPPELCPRIQLVGAAAAAEHLTVGRFIGAELQIESRRIDDGSGEVVASEALSVDAGSVVWVGESAAEGFRALVQTSEGRLVYVASAVAATPGPVVGSIRGVGVGPGADELWIDATGAAGEEFLLWSPGAGTPAKSLSPPALESGFGAWQPEERGSALASRATPNPDDPSLTVPLEYRVRTLAAGDFTTMSAATTPCVSRDRCRLYAESELLRLLDDAGGLGLYSTWTWTGRRALFVAATARADRGVR